MWKIYFYKRLNNRNPWCSHVLNPIKREPLLQWSMDGRTTKNISMQEKFFLSVALHRSLFLLTCMKSWHLRKKDNLYDMIWGAHIKRWSREDSLIYEHPHYIVEESNRRKSFLLLILKFDNFYFKQNSTVHKEVNLLKHKFFYFNLKYSSWMPLHLRLRIEFHGLLKKIQSIATLAIIT